MDAQSDTQRQDQEQTHMRNNESGAGFENHHGEKTEVVQACGEETKEIRIFVIICEITQ